MGGRYKGQLIKHTVTYLNEERNVKIAGNLYIEWGKTIEGESTNYLPTTITMRKKELANSK